MNCSMECLNLLCDFGISNTHSLTEEETGILFISSIDRSFFYMTLNKHQGIRAALCWIPEISHLARQHNNANILVMPGRYITNEVAEKVLNEFFSTDFEGGRHQRRIEKIPVK